MDTQESADRQVTEKGLREIRIAWKIGESAGGGLWKHDTIEHRALTAAWVQHGNETYGEGTHWIERRQA